MRTLLRRWSILSSGALALSLSLAHSAQAQSQVVASDTCQNTPCTLDPADADVLKQAGYQLLAVPSDRIDSYLSPTTKDPRIPATIQGIWWVTVNPLNFVLASVGGDSSWDDSSRTLAVHFYGEKTVSFRYTGVAAQAYVSFVRNHFTFEFKFADDDKMATLTSVFEIFGQRLTLPESILRYQMRWVEDGHFVRESWLFGQRLPDYQLRRVVRADGTRDATFASYLLSADAKSYIAVKAD